MKTRFKISKLSLRRFSKRLMKALRLMKAAESAFCLSAGFCFAPVFFAAGAFAGQKASGMAPTAEARAPETSERRRRAGFSNQERLARLCKPPAGALSLLPYEVHRANQAVWSVKNPAEGEDWGATGFFIGPGLFLINFHVVTYLLNGADETGGVEASFLSHPAQPGAAMKIKAVRALNPSHDLALLETEGREAPYLSLAEKPAEKEDKLFASGYFGQTFQTVRKTGPLKRLDGFLIFPVNRTPFLAFERSGQSGGPVLTAEGRVVGMLAQDLGNHQAAVNLFRLRNFAESQSGLQCGESGAQECFAKALDLLSKEAKEGRPSALYRSGKLIMAGAEDREGLEAPLSLFRQAAENGHIMSALSLSALSLFLPPSYDRAGESLYWLKRAAEAGLAPAQRKLGSGETPWLGLFQRREEEFYWLKQAAEGGESEAQYLLSLMKSPGEIFRSYRDALIFGKNFHWLKRAAENGHFLAVRALALICHEGAFEGGGYWSKQALKRARLIDPSFFNRLRPRFQVAPKKRPREIF